MVLQARYEYGDKQNPITGLSQMVLDVTVKQRPKSEEIATAEVETSVEKLEERRPFQMVYLVITNLTDVPLELRGVRASLPKFAQIGDAAPDSDGWTSLLPPRPPLRRLW